MMKNKHIMVLVGLGCSILLGAQEQDTTLLRSVTVEREFQPIIQSAGKLNITPDRLEVEQKAPKLEYSSFSAPVTTTFNFNPLTSSAVRFNNPHGTDGYLEGNLGHHNTYLDFRYRLHERKNVTLDLYAKHDGSWCEKMIEDSKLGMKFNKQFTACNVFFDVEGQHQFYTRYGRYFDGDKGLTIDHYSDLKAEDKQAIWNVRANVGVRSRQGASVQYLVQTGYNAFILPSTMSEHIVRTKAQVEWSGEAHHAGANLFVQNAFMVMDTLNIADSLFTSRHAIRFEPYYAYKGEKVHIHAGINIDMNIGRGSLMSTIDNLSFAPSPNIRLDYRILPTWLLMYAEAKGQFGAGIMQDYMNWNRYLAYDKGVTSKHVCGYTPIDAALGFRIRPVETFLIDVFARYAYRMNQKTLYADMPKDGTNPLFLNYFYSDWQQWTVGAELTYHYQDIVHILLGGHYYKWIQQDMHEADNLKLTYDPKTSYDRPSWDLHFRVDANIDSKWSLYSDNTFGGARQALTTNGEVRLGTIIDLNLGAQYNINRWLSCYMQLNNYLNRKNDLYYTYQSHGIHGVLGVKWQF